MLIRTLKKSNLPSSAITPYSVFVRRRKFLQSAAMFGLTSAIGPYTIPKMALARNQLSSPQKTKWTLKNIGNNARLTPYTDITSYNNFYEFGTAKQDPKLHAGGLKTRPWTVVVDGHAEKTGRYAFEDLIKLHHLQDRIYRFRCVETWSMVVPWVGIPLADIVKKLGPTSNAKYVAFETLADPEQMPGLRSRVLDWPYLEGLRIDEAIHPLTLLVVGLYGEILPNQNGAPIRLVVPWKYGFKSIKSIVRISFTEKQPPTSWNLAAPREYGFYSNVNPKVHHPRWSQAKERLLGSSTNVFGFTPKIPTLMFNGYSEEVASLYKGMYLTRFF